MKLMRVRSNHRGQVGFPGIRPGAAVRRHPRDRAARRRRSPPAWPARRRSGSGERPHAARSASRGQVLDRRLAVDAREHQPRQQRGGPRVQRRPRLPARRARGRRRPAPRTRRRSARATAAATPPLSSRWFSTKARSNAGSPYHAHSASSITGPARPDQHILRAEVAVHQHAPRRAPSSATAPSAPAARSGCAARGGLEVGLEPDRVEDRVGGEARGDVRPVGGGGVDRGRARRRPRRRSRPRWRRRASCAFHTG